MDEVVVWLIYHHHTDQSYYLCYSVREPHWNNCQTCGKPEHTGSTSNYIARVWEMTAKLETYQELCYPNQCLYFIPTSVVSIKYFPLHSLYF